MAIVCADGSGPARNGFDIDHNQPVRRLGEADLEGDIPAGVTFIRAGVGDGDGGITPARNRYIVVVVDSRRHGYRSQAVIAAASRGEGEDRRLVRGVVILASPQPDGLRLVPVLRGESHAQPVHREPVRRTSRNADRYRALRSALQRHRDLPPLAFFEGEVRRADDQAPLHGMALIVFDPRCRGHRGQSSVVAASRGEGEDRRLVRGVVIEAGAQPDRLRPVPGLRREVHALRVHCEPVRRVPRNTNRYRARRLGLQHHRNLALPTFLDGEVRRADDQAPLSGFDPGERHCRRCKHRSEKRPRCEPGAGKGSPATRSVGTGPAHGLRRPCRSGESFPRPFLLLSWEHGASAPEQAAASVGTPSWPLCRTASIPEPPLPRHFQ